MKPEQINQSREEFDVIDNDYQKVKEQIAEAKNADEILALAQKLKSLEGSKKEMIGEAQEAAAEEDKLRTAWDEAHEENKKLDELKVQKAEEDATEIEKIRAQIKAAGSAEEIEGLARRLKRVEDGSEDKDKKVEKYGRAAHLLKDLFTQAEGGWLDPFWNRVSKAHEEVEKELLTIFKDIDQRALAESFFNDTIGQSLDNVKSAYMVYKLLKGTEFANKFKELESARLRKAGYSELNI